MSNVSSATKKELLAKVFGLTMACPREQSNPPDCPLFEVRKLSLKERHEWVRNLSEGDMRMLLEHHEKCSARKMLLKP